MTTFLSFMFYTLALIGAALSLVLMMEGHTLESFVLFATMGLVTLFHAIAN